MILLIGTLRTNGSEIIGEIHIFPFKEMHLKMSFAKWQAFCLGLNVCVKQAQEVSSNSSQWSVGLLNLFSTWGLPTETLAHYYMAFNELNRLPVYGEHTGRLKGLLGYVGVVVNGEDMKWKHFPNHWPFEGNLLVSGRFSWKWINDANLWCSFNVSLNRLLSKHLSGG